MRRDPLPYLSLAQLGTGVAGLVSAVRHRYAYDIVGLHGSPDHVLRDGLTLGTAYSAPAPMLLAQAAAAHVLARRPDPRARRVLGALGAAMVPGYLGERQVRQRLSPVGRHRTESPVLLAGLTLAGVMAWLGLGSRQSASPSRAFDPQRAQRCQSAAALTAMK